MCPINQVEEIYELRHQVALLEKTIKYKEDHYDAISRERDDLQRQVDRLEVQLGMRIIEESCIGGKGPHDH